MSVDDEDMLVLEGGMLGRKDKDDTDKFIPIMNFNFTIQHFVGDEQMECQRVCIRVDVHSSQIYNLVFLDHEEFHDPIKFMSEINKQIKGQFVTQYDKIPKKLYKEYVKTLQQEFMDRLSWKKPVRNIGLQTFLLEENFCAENVEFFLNPRDGIIGADGKKKENPQCIFDAPWFKRYHNTDDTTMKNLFVDYIESGRFGLLERMDYPYVSSKSGNAYFEDVNIMCGFLYLQNDFWFQKNQGFSGVLLIMGPTGVGKTR